MDFESFRERKVKETLAGALLCWPTVVLCPFAIGYELGDLLERESKSLAENIADDRYFIHSLAEVWLLMAMVRVFLMMSPLRRHPFFSRGLWERRDSKPITAVRAARHVIVSEGPWHVLALYVVVMRGPITMTGAFAAIVIVAALLCVRFFVQYHYRGAGSFGSWSGTELRLLPQTEQRIAAQYARYSSSQLYRARYKAYVIANRAARTMMMMLLAAAAIQIARTPRLNPAYEPMVYAGWEAPVWEDNAYIAMHGLHAPVDSKDWYEHGRAIVAAWNDVWERGKRRAGIDKARPEGVFPELEDDGHVSLFPDEEKLAGIRCLYDENYEGDAPCMDAPALREKMAAYETVWGRFNALPDYGTYSAIPQHMGTYVQDLHLLTQMKAAEIAVMANEGQADKAVAEWARFMPFYNAVAAGRDTNDFKALAQVMRMQHIKALQYLIHRYPAAVAAQAGGIEKLLITSDEPVHVRMMADDVALNEPAALWHMGNVNAIRNDVYECIVAEQKQLARAIHELSFAKEEPDCRLKRRALGGDLGSTLGYILTLPGYYAANTRYFQMTPDLLWGRNGFLTARLNEVEMRQTALAVAMLREGVAAAEVPAYLQEAPEKFRNPLTRAPFLWDVGQKSLYFESPRDGKRRTLKLPL